MKKTFNNTQAPEQSLAVVYCRISSKKQDREGDGLASQETRLREYALRMKYDVVACFATS